MVSEYYEKEIAALAAPEEPKGATTRQNAATPGNEKICIVFLIVRVLYFQLL